MDLLAALALVLVIEGLALAIFARSLPAVMSEIDSLDGSILRRIGLVMLVVGAFGYLLVRQNG